MASSPLKHGVMFRYSPNDTKTVWISPFTLQYRGYIRTVPDLRRALKSITGAKGHGPLMRCAYGNDKWLRVRHVDEVHNHVLAFMDYD